LRIDDPLFPGERLRGTARALGRSRLKIATAVFDSDVKRFAPD
jgi:hypothetical protein